MNLNFYADPDHQPFRLTTAGPRAAGAVLLIHGFLGTPAEMRPLGLALQQAGLEVEGVLLPGFGPQIQNLGHATWQDWIDAATHAALALQRDFEHTLVVGFSLGGAIAAQVAAHLRLDGLALLAPFVQLGNGLHQLLWPLIRLALPEIRPFQRSDFRKAEVRRAVHGFLPDLDLDNPAVQEELRRLRLPTRIMDQLRLAGRRAVQAAPRIQAPVLCLQGRHDPVVRPAHSRRLVRHLPNLVRFAEVDGDHLLVSPSHRSWDATSDLVRGFVHQIVAPALHPRELAREP